MTPRQLFFPELNPYYFQKYEKEILENCRLIRRLFLDIVEKRRVEMKKDSYVEKGDLLAMLLEDELFANDNEVIIDQCMTFFFAGSQTLFFSTSNLIMFVHQNPEQLEKIRSEY